MSPFECTRCRKISYHPSQRMASCCENKSLLQLTSICFLIPSNKEPTFKVVHKSPSSGALKLTSPGQEWATACNAVTIPRVTTLEESAVTCYKCRKWIEKRDKEIQARQEFESVESFIKDSKLENTDSDTDDVVFELGEVRKELERPEGFASLEDLDAFLTKLQNLHTMSKQRKFVTGQKQLLQEFRK